MSMSPDPGATPLERLGVLVLMVPGVFPLVGAILLALGRLRSR